MLPINVAIFPCGSEVGLEINRALRYSRHFNLIGLNSISDHGRMVFDHYIEGIPFLKDPEFIPTLKGLVYDQNIRFLIPAMDEVAAILKENEEELGCEVVCADPQIIRLLTAKSKVYKRLKDVIPVPEVYDTYDAVKDHLPVFSKPDIGYGSREAALIENEAQLWERWNKRKMLIFCENLPGKEYTIDCFSDTTCQVLFAGPRVRKRVRMGISVNTVPVELEGIQEMAQKIGASLNLSGTWFFQMKENESGNLVLLEVASRVSGSMAMNRLRGVNFVLLELFQRMGYAITVNPYLLPDMELERAFNCRLKTDLEFDAVYMDFDDCLLIKGQINTQILRFLYQQLNAGKKIILLTKHVGDLHELLRKWRIESLFDEVIHIKPEERKFQYVVHKRAIFVDDSHSERLEIQQHCHIPTFAPDVIESLIDDRKV